ncbi:MAG: BPSS1780 family membrane protein [Gallionella sp.]|nr:BPSS1780 family membrane protein [Gallionella sp.]
MEIKKFTAARGWTWIKQGYQLIMISPILSITTALIAALAIFLAMLIPLIGPLLAVILMPIMLAGYMRICRALEEGEEVELTDLLAGFKKSTPALVSLGAFLMLGMLFASAVMVFVGGDALTTLMEEVRATDNPQVLMDAIRTASGGVAFAVLLGFTLVLMLIVAWQYAPMLVFFSGVPPFMALRDSFVGTMRNIVPYTVYSLIMQVIALMLGILPFGLGMILLLPLGLTSLYVSYRNIFPWLDAPVAPPVAVDTNSSNDGAD